MQRRRPGSASSSTSTSNARRRASVSDMVAELQNGLMKTRMVPFQRHVQRLTRIVRQAAQEVGKKAELVVEGAAGELDRQVLERMLPPFEHMLRNAARNEFLAMAAETAAAKPSRTEHEVQTGRKRPDSTAWAARIFARSLF